VVLYEKVSNTAYSDGFPVLFAFYAVLIPTSVLNTALVGVAIMLILATPQLLAHAWGGLAGAIMASSTAFAILLCGRYIANTAWQREFEARKREVEARESATAAWQREVEARKREVEARESATAASNLQANFVAAVSHDFRNAITALCLWSKQLLDGKIPEPGRLDCYQVLAEESHRLSFQVQGLLDFAKLEAGSHAYKFLTVDPAEEVKKMAKEFERDPASRGWRVDVEVSDDAPLIKADQAALQSVLWNLLDNAVKYSPECRTIWVYVGQKEGMASIRIQDRGRGISEADLPHIFKPFVRSADAMASHVRGFGVGLALVLHIITAHDGTIHVESKVNQGSSFTVLLPTVI
jgi:signal transduction histidine kinase